MGHCCPPACLPDCGAHGCRALPTLPSAQAVANAPVQPQTPAMTHSVGYRGAPAAAPVQPMAQGYYNPYYNAGYGYGYGYYPQMQMNYPGYWNWNMGR